jgi:ABC-type polysaccharide/polyol phosphate export permease
MHINPLHYTIDGLRATIYWDSFDGESLRVLLTSTLITAGFGLATFGLSVAMGSGVFSLRSAKK